MEFLGFKYDGFVKSPSAALRFTFVAAAYHPSTPHSSGFARLASGAFYAAIPLATFYEIINFDGFVKSPSAALRFTFVVAAYHPCTPHSSCFARLASGAFYAAIPLATFYEIINYDEFVKSRNSIEYVIPAKAGIQLFQGVLDPGFRRGDDPKDFLRDHQNCEVKIYLPPTHCSFIPSGLCALPIFCCGRWTVDCGRFSPSGHLVCLVHLVHLVVWSVLSFLILRPFPFDFKPYPFLLFPLLLWSVDRRLWTI